MIKRITLFALALAIQIIALAANSSQTVSQVTSEVTLSTPVDYHITGTTPFATAGSINLNHEDAVVIFDAIKPSKVISSYLRYINVNGNRATNDATVHVSVWKNGAIVYPHPNTTFKPLTVFTEKNFGGESENNYVPYRKYGSLGSFLNNIRSFKLKRGYMACLATNTDGTGYSRVFIAQDEDMEVADLGKYLSGKVGFIRIVAWKAVSKKGTANSDVNMLNAQSTYNWGGGDDPLTNVDYEYVGMHHHEGWTNWGDLANNAHEIHVLGNNEPDNSGDSKEQYIPRADIEKTLFANGAWQESQKTGMRIGSPAPSGDIGGWLGDFMNLSNKYNQRIDFVVLHLYWYASGDSYSSQVNSVYNSWHRPVWISEWNYGANWTGETWPDGNRGAGTRNQAHAKAGISDIVTKLEANPHLERYMIYNWVEDCRSVILNNSLTPAGQWYADHKSNMAYTGGEGYVPGWTYWAPTDLTVTYTKSTKKAVLNWKSENGKQTDSVWVERKVDGVDRDFVRIATLGLSQSKNLQYSADDLSDVAGLVTYRICNFDSDGKKRYTGEAYVTIGTSTGNETLQYGKLTVSTTEGIDVGFGQALESIPAIFTGIPTNKNTTMTPTAMVTSVTKKGFTYQMLPWQQSGTQTVESNEQIPFMAMLYGNYKYGDMDVEVGSTKVGADTIEVLFNQPFPEGVKPVVITEFKPILKTYPLMVRIWDVTNTGFKAVALYEAGLNKKVATAQTLMYMACTPGIGIVSDDIQISAGISENTLYGTTMRQEVFDYTNPDGTVSEDADSIALENPFIFGSAQTYNYPTGIVLRRMTDITTVGDDDITYTYGSRIKRCVDGSATVSVKNNKDTGDEFGWICISAPSVPAGINDVIIARSEDPIRAEVINKCIYVEGDTPYTIYNINGTKVAANATQEPGVYIVRQGKKTAKVIVR